MKDDDEIKKFDTLIPGVIFSANGSGIILRCPDHLIMCTIELEGFIDAAQKALTYAKEHAEHE